MNDGKRPDHRAHHLWRQHGKGGSYCSRCLVEIQPDIPRVLVGEVLAPVPGALPSSAGESVCQAIILAWWARWLPSHAPKRGRALRMLPPAPGAFVAPASAPAGQAVAAVATKKVPPPAAPPLPRQRSAISQ